jgi:hypothetical protein
MEPNGINIVPASNFGDLKVAWRGKQLMLDSKSCIDDIFNSMEGTAKSGDKLLCVGDPSVIALCAVVLNELTDGVFDILKWDRVNKKYYKVGVNYYHE